MLPARSPYTALGLFHPATRTTERGTPGPQPSLGPTPGAECDPHQECASASIMPWVNPGARLGWMPTLNLRKPEHEPSDLESCGSEQCRQRMLR